MPSVEKAEQILSDSADAGKLHHAILLYGQSLAELEKVAKKIASKLFKRPAEHHPDLFELRPEGKARMIKVGSDGDKIGGELPVNTMRRLLAELRQSSNAGGAKVAIVYEADRMNNITANAFLKTLEEPPRDTTIFMLSSRPNDLLDTIRSRCIAMKIDTPPAHIDDPDWLKWLEDLKAWQKDLMRRQKFAVDEVIMRAYGLLSRFDTILTRLTDELTEGKDDPSEELDEEVVEAMVASERKGLRKKMLSQIEDACVACALGGDGVPAVKISRIVDSLEQCAGYMELNMNESAALEYFILSSIRIWTR